MFNINFVGIRTGDIWCRKQLLCRLSHSISLFKKCFSRKFSYSSRFLIISPSKYTKSFSFSPICISQKRAQRQINWKRDCHSLFESLTATHNLTDSKEDWIDFRPMKPVVGSPDQNELKASMLLSNCVRLFEQFLQTIRKIFANYSKIFCKLILVRGDDGCEFPLK